MMVAVALAALILAGFVALERRRARFERMFSHHRSLTGPMTIRSFEPDRPIFLTPRGKWHYEMSMKYARASRSPWLPVEPDPPEPE
jgi:hypothetical protein